MRKKGLTIFLTMALTVSALAGCGNSSTGNSQDVSDKQQAKSEEAAGEMQEIEFLSQKREDVDIFDNILAEFMGENPDIKMTQTTTSGSVSVASRVASNDIPDLINVYASTSYREMAKEGLFLDLRDQPFLEKIPEEYLKLFTLEDGTIWALPINVNAVGLYINEDIYEECNLQVPETFEQLIANCKVLMQKGYNPFTFPFKDSGGLRQVFERYLVGCVDHDFVDICDAVGKEGKSYADYPDFVSGLETWVNLLDYTNTDPLASDPNDMTNSFANGESAMMIYSVAALSQVTNTNPDLNFSVHLLPSATEGMESTAVGTPDMVFAISKESENIEGCERFLTWFMEDEHIENFTSQDMIPTIVDGVEYKNPQSKEIWDAIEEGRFTISPTVSYANGFQNAFMGELQGLIMERDINKFIETLDTVTREVYSQQ